jgi:Fic family protein
MTYEPPFKISAKIIDLVSQISEISANVERVKINLEKADSIKLRKLNRMKTIRGSLAIEENSLSEEQVTALTNAQPAIHQYKNQICL